MNDNLVLLEPHANEFTQARWKLVGAKVEALFDKDSAAQRAEEVFHAVVWHAALCDVPPTAVPWSLRSEPILVLAFMTGSLLCQQRIEIIRRNLDRLAQRKPDLECGVLDTPSAENMLDALRAGQTLELNFHSLAFDEEFDVLAGTNAYGCDYYWGQMSLHSVSQWREKMLAGEDIGPVPSGSHIDDADDDDGDPVTHELVPNFLSLEAMVRLDIDARSGDIKLCPSYW